MICNNVLAHVPNLNDFIAGLKLLLKPKGIITLEFPSLCKLIENNQFDTIYHEHLRYYSLESLKYLFNKYGMKIIHAKKINTHGGSIRVYATKKNKLKVNKSVANILNLEKNFLHWKTFEKFKKKVVQ